MLLVETNNCKEQSSLQQQFSREGNLFAVPIKKTSQISLILKRMLFQKFGQLNTVTEQKNKNQFPLINLINKLMLFFQNVLKLNFSLSIIHEIFQIIKIDSIKLKFYIEYFNQIDRQLMEGGSQQSLQNQINLNKFCKNDLQSQLQQQNQRKNHQYDVYDTQLAQITDGIKSNVKQESEKQHNINSVVSINCKFDSPVNQDAETMHSLRSQFMTSPKFSITPLNQINMDLYKMGNNKLQNSFHCSEDDGRYEENPIINVRDQGLTIDKNTNYVFYCPQWKKNEEDQKKMLKSVISTQPTTKKSGNDSNYIQNLSGRVHPVPSFMHDDSLSQMIVKQKKEDVRKSSILRKSIIVVDENKTVASQHAYSSNLRLIKFHNKLRKNSKKSLAVKSDFDQQKDQRQKHQIQMPVLTSHNQKLIRCGSQNNLSKIYQKYEQKQLQKSKSKQKQKFKQVIGQNTKIGDVTQRKLNIQELQLKISKKDGHTINKNKATKYLNFFKSKKQQNK